VLASGSPRRARILRSLAVPFHALVTEVDETLAPGEAVEVAAERLARAKAAAADAALPVLAADTVVACEGRILGKPRDAEDAAAMLRLLAGRVHQVVTGVCVRRGARLHSGVERSDVAFEPMSEAEIAWYVATGEPMDKAGAYHIEGRGALFVSSVSGSPSNVAGLPVGLVRRLLREAGVSVGWP
jgi:septum formation protein